MKQTTPTHPQFADGTGRLQCPEAGSVERPGPTQNRPPGAGGAVRQPGARRGRSVALLAVAAVFALLCGLAPQRADAVWNGVSAATNLGTLTATANTDNITITTDGAGHLQHNIVGNGFNSAIDFDNTVAGDQTLTVAAGTTLNIVSAGGTIQLGTAASTTTTASALLARINVSNQNLGGSLTVNDGGNIAANTITVNGAGGAITGTGINVQNLLSGSFSGGVFVTTGQAADTVNVLSTASGSSGPEPVTLNSTGNNDIVNIGNAGSVQTILAPVNVNNSPSFTILTIDDSADATGRTAILNPASITGLAPAAINWTITDIATLTINGGSGGNTFTVTGTAPGFADTLNTGTGSDTVTVQGTSNTLNVNGQNGADTVTIGNAGSVQGINGVVNITNAFAFTSIIVDDSADGTARTATINNTGITGLAPAAINYVQNDVNSLTVNGGTGGNTFTVAATPSIGHTVPTVLNSGTGADTVAVQTTSGAGGSTLTVNGQNGADTVTIGNAGSTAGIAGAVTVGNALGSTSLIADDSADATGSTVAVNGTSITGLPSATINYSAASTTVGVTAVTVSTGTANDTVTVTPDPNITFTVNGGPQGAVPPGDTLNLTLGGATNPALNITGITGPSVSGQYTFGNRRPVNFTSIETYSAAGISTLTITGSPGADTLVINATSPNSGTFTFNGFGPFPFSGLTSLTFNGGGGTDLLTINNPAGSLFAPTGGIFYNGGGFAGDSLQDLGGTASFGSYTVGPTTDAGTLSYTNVGLGLIQTITFTGLAPITDTVAAGTFTINGTNASETITLDDGLVVGDGMIRVSVGAFESIEFANKTNLIINAGLSAANAGDTVNLSNTEYSTGLASITVNGVGGANTFNVNTRPPAAGVTYALNGGPTAGTLNLTSTPGAFDPQVITPTAQGAGTLVSFGGVSDSITYSGIANIGLTGQVADLDAFGVNGTAGSDNFIYSQGVTPDAGTVTGTLNGGAFTLPNITFVGMLPDSTNLFNDFGPFGGTDTFTYNGPVGVGGYSVNVDASALLPTIQTFEEATFFSNLGVSHFATLFVNGSVSNDTFNVTPGATTAVTVDGKPGFDFLNVDLTGTSTPTFTSTGFNAGIITFAPGIGSRAPITFSNIEAVAPQNQPPTIAVPAAQTTNQDTAKTFSAGGGNAITVADPDAGTNPVRVSLSVGHGTLTLATVAGLTFSTGTGTANDTMVFTGTTVAINAALSGLVYTPDPGFNGADLLTVAVDDMGNTGFGGPKAATATVGLTVLPGNQPPTVALPGPQTIAQDTNLTFAPGTALVATVADPDSGGLAEQITVTAVNGTIKLGTTAGITVTTGNPTSGTSSTLVFTGTLPALNAALNSLTFIPTTGFTGTASLTVSINDLGHSGPGGPLSATATMLITVQAVPRQISITNASVVEGNSGTTPMTFTVRLSQASNVAISAHFATADATAKAGTSAANGDYQATSGTVTFAPGTTTQTITVNVFGNTIQQPNRTFFVQLSSPTGGAILTNTSGTGLIIDDDGAPSLSVTDSSVVEGPSGATNMMFKVTLAPTSGQVVTVDFATSDGTAKAGQDYVATSGNLNFAPGSSTRTIVVPILSDDFVAPVETFKVTLSNALNANIAGATATGFIVNNAPAPVTIGFISPSEGDVFNHFPNLVGLVNGIANPQVAIAILRKSDNTYFTGSSWQPAPTLLPASVLANRFTFSGSLLPSNLADGAYGVAALVLNANGISIANAVVNFNVDSQPPTVTIAHPANNAALRSLDYFAGHATDAPGGTGVQRVDLFLRRASDGKYWDETQHKFRLATSPADTPVLTTTLSSTLWVKRTNLPATGTDPNTSLTPGTYRLLAKAYDRAFHSDLAVITFTVLAPATPAVHSVALSTATASVSSSSITLHFGGALDAATASDAGNYSVTVNGHAATVESAGYNSATHTVTLSLADGSLHSGDKVTASWSGLTDGQGNPVSGKTGSVTAR